MTRLGRPPLDAPQRARLAELLAKSPRPSDQDIADEMDIGRSTVARYRLGKEWCK